MASFYWTSVSSGVTGRDPGIVGNWTKSDGTTNTLPGAGDDVYIQAVPGLALADIWAAGGANFAAPGSLSTSGASSTGGHLAQSTTYYYKVSAISTATGYNGEGPLSSELTYAVPASGTATNQITVNWAVVPNATGYKIYRGTSTGAELYLATVGAVLLYADTTATTPAGAAPGAATFNSLTISSTYTGKIGSGGQGGYWDQPATTWTIGTPPASAQGLTAGGSGRIKIDFGAAQFAGTVLASGSATDVGFEPIIVKGAHASNVLTVLGGTVGVATATPGETATILTTNVSGSNAVLHYGAGVTWGGSGAAANVSSNARFIADTGATASNATLTISTGSTATINGSTKVTNVNTSGTLVLNNRPASGNIIDLLNHYAGTIDCTGNPAAGTLGTWNHYGTPNGSLLSTSPAAPNHVTVATAYNKIGGGKLTLTA